MPTKREPAAGWVATMALGLALAGAVGALYLGGSALLAVLHPVPCLDLGMNDCALARDLEKHQALRQALVAVALVLLAVPAASLARRKNRTPR